MDLRVVVDRFTLEVFGADGAMSGTTLHFFADPPTRLGIRETGGAMAVDALHLTTLAPAVRV